MTLPQLIERLEKATGPKRRRRLTKRDKQLLGVLERVRRFPDNTCPASRHAQMVGEALLRDEPYPQIQEEPEHVGESILYTVAALYAARTRIVEIEAEVARHLSLSGEA